jgi:predicted Zn finger-like uncharacterized protein
MKFVCDRCQTKYSIADEKVRGKVLKVRCKTCGNVITVREGPSASAGGRQSVPSMAPVRPSSSSLAPVKPSSPSMSAVRGAAGQRAAEAVLDDDDEDFGPPADERERTVIAPAPLGFMAEVAAAQKSAARPPAPPPKDGDGVQWFLALDGKQTGPFSRKALVDKVLALPRDADVHVWNELLDGWKEPREVPEIARDIVAARRKPSPPPPPPKAATSRPTPAHPLPTTGAPPRGRPYPAGAPPSASMAAPAPATGPRLAPPTSAPVRLSATHAVVDAPDGPPLPDAPPPPFRPGKPANGLGATGSVRAAAPAAVMPQAESDALSALNLATVVPAAAEADPAGVRNGQQAAAPRLVSASAMMGLDVGARAPEAAQGRHRSAKLILGVLGVVGVVCSIILFNVFKKPGPVETPAVAKQPGQGESQFGNLAEEVAQEKGKPGAPEAPAPEVLPPHAKTATVGPSKSRVQARPGRGGGSHEPTAPSPVAAEDPSASRFRDTGSRTMQIPTASTYERRPPSQEEISRVINNNKAGIKTCYQRALLRDNTLTHGKITVRVSIGLSGRVKNVGVDGPMQFRALEPCIREMLGRWVFPPASEEYGTEFSYLFQGNE